MTDASARRRSTARAVALLLAVAWYGLAAAVAITICLIAIGSPIVVRLGPGGAPDLDAAPNAAMALPVAVAIDPGRIPIASSSPGGPTAHLQQVRGSLTFVPRPHDGASTTVLAAIVAALLIFLWVLGELRAVFRTLSAGRPFVAANVRRIRHIGWAVIVGEIVRAALVAGGSQYAMHHFAADGLRLEVRPDLNVSVLICGLIVLALAEVFREGTALDEDRSLTI